MSDTPRLNKLLDENSEAGMLPIDRYSAVIAFAAGIERELTAEKERSARLEKALCKYGEHHPDCSVWDLMDSGKRFPRDDWTCDCGYRSVLLGDTNNG